MKQKLYIETSVISYLTARPSRDLIIAAHQQITTDWWGNRRAQFDLYTSQVVLNEASLGDSEAASKRTEALQGIDLLDITDEVAELSEKLISEKCLPEKAVEDTLHIAISAIHGTDYLLTWNCKHIANAEMRLQIEEIIRISGYKPPIICTPEELLGE